MILVNRQITSTSRLFHKRGAAAWRHSRQLFWVAFCVRQASATTLTGVVFAIRPRRSTVAPSPDIQVLSDCGSGTPERPGGTLCVQERVASAGRAEVVRCGGIYDCYTPVLLPHWALTADDPSDAFTYGTKLPPSLRVPCQSATWEYSSPLPGSDSALKSVVGMSHRVFHSRLKTHLFSRSFPP